MIDFTFLNAFADSAFFWSALIFSIACAFAGIAAIRLSLRGEAVTSMMAISSLTTVLGVSLYLISLPELFNVGFARDTAIALLVVGSIGTIAFARMFRSVK